VKDKLHEKIASNALGALQPPSARLFDEGYLHRGVRYNDMPGGSENDYLDVLHFGADFKGHDTKTLVWNSHYGCLQMWHSMAPAFEPQNVPDKGQVTNVLFTQADVRRLIRTHLKYMWQRFVDEKQNKNARSFWIGKMLHLVGDSYAGGHAVRGWMQEWHEGRSHVDPFRNLDNFDGQSLRTLSTSGFCGWLLYFQGYGAQHGNDEHAAMDHDPTDVLKGAGRTDAALRSRGVRCATSANVVILNAAAKCISGAGSCFFDLALKPAFKEWYRLSVPAAISGGSLASMADKDIANNAAYAAVKIVYTDLTGAKIDSQVWAPKYESTQEKATGEWMWTELPLATPICPKDMTARSGLLKAKKPFMDFHNTNNQYKDPLHLM